MSYKQAKIERAVRELKDKGQTNFADHYLKDDGIVELANKAGCIPGIASLDLSGNDIRVKGVCAVAELIEKTASLKSLSLCWNYVGISGAAERLSAALAKNRSIRMLDLRNNRIDPAGAEALGKMLRENRTLTSIDLRWNSLMDIGGQALLNGLRRNASLIAMPLAGNKMSVEIQDKIESALRRNAENSRKGVSLDEAERLIAEELTLPEAKKIGVEGTKAAAQGGGGLGLVSRLAKSHVRFQAEEKNLKMRLAVEKTKAEKLSDKLEAEITVRETLAKQAEEKLKLSVSEKLQLSEAIVKQSFKLTQERKACMSLTAKMSEVEQDNAKLREQVRILEVTHGEREIAAEHTIEDLRTQLRALHLELERATTMFEDRTQRMQQVAKHEIEMRESERTSKQRMREDMISKHEAQIAQVREKYEAEISQIQLERKNSASQNKAAQLALAEAKRQLMEEKVKNEEVHSAAEARAQSAAEERTKTELLAFKERLAMLEKSRNDARQLAQRQEKDQKRLTSDHAAEIKLHRIKYSEISKRLGDAESMARKYQTDLTLSKQKLEFLKADVDRANAMAKAREKDLIKAVASHQETARRLTAHHAENVRTLEEKISSRDARISALLQRIRELDDEQTNFIRSMAPLANSLSRMQNLRKIDPLEGLETPMRSTGNRWDEDAKRRN